MAQEKEILPKRESIRDLFSKYYFKIPLFQRDYSWESDKWEDFWDDISGHMNKDYDFFLGSIVVKDLKKDANYEIIDGQQRVTTCIILLAVIRDFLKEKANDLFSEIQKPYITHKEALRSSQSRLSLNKYDNPFFQRYIVNLDEDISQVRNRGLNHGERNIFKAYYYFKVKVDSFSSNIESLLESILDKTYLILIQVEDDVQAYTVFETLNARGLDLTAADLIKNSIFSKASSLNKLEPINEIWDRIQKNLSCYSLTTFFKYYITTKLGIPIREKDLFKKIKSIGFIDQDIEKTISQLEIDSKTYLNLLEPTISYWEDKEIPDILNNISLMRLKTCYPFLLAISKSKLKTSTKKELFHEVEKLGFRYNLILKNNPNQLERKYAEWSCKLFKEAIQVQELKIEINKMKPSDEDFYNEFLNFSSTENKISSYILRKIGYGMHDSELLEIRDSASVEHIIPESPSKWLDYIKKTNEIKINGVDVSLSDFVNHLIFRIGNQTLLLPDDNSKLGDETFDVKKDKVYSKSKFKLNQEIALEPNWGLEEINKFQKKLAEIAKKMW